MKKVSVMTILVFSAVIFTGCYDDSKNATVRINLGNMPVAKNVEKKSFIDKVFSVFVKDAYAQNLTDINIIKIHLAAYKGNNLIAHQSFETTGMSITNNVVEFSVPAGDDLNIVVLGERYEGSVPVYNDISYYGKTESSFSINAGEEKNMVIVMNDIETYTNFLVVLDVNNHNISWNGILGANTYVVDSQFNTDFTPRYSGVNTSFTLINGALEDIFYYRLIIHFDFSNKNSKDIIYSF